MDPVVAEQHTLPVPPERRTAFLGKTRILIGSGTTSDMDRNDGHPFSEISETTLVLMTSDASPKPAPPSTMTDPSVSGQRPAPGEPFVLLVEDNPINQVVALEFLALMGLKTQLARNGQEALDLCEQAAPNLVLMDIQMPGMDGLECARRLREQQAQGRLPRFPILALTAHALDSDVADSLKAGMDEHLTKPLDFLTLRRRLARWLDLPQLND
jgi:CheY-like chemotaxis protein